MVCKDFDLYYLMFLQHPQATVTVWIFTIFMMFPYLGALVINVTIHCWMVRENTDAVQKSKKRLENYRSNETIPG